MYCPFLGGAAPSKAKGAAGKAEGAAKAAPGTPDRAATQAAVKAE